MNTYRVNEKYVVNFNSDTLEGIAEELRVATSKIIGGNPGVEVDWPDRVEIYAGDNYMYYMAVDLTKITDTDEGLTAEELIQKLIKEG